MALPDIMFENNLTGSTPVRFSRATVGITDRYEWNGRSARHRKTISIQAFVKRGENKLTSEGLERLMTTARDPTRAGGSAGTLTLPWTTLTNVKLTGASFGGDGQWIEYVPVNLQFEDQWPDGNIYRIDLFGITLHNPRFGIDISGREPVDDYFQMPASVNGLDTSDPRYAILRAYGNQKMIQCSIAGTVTGATIEVINGMRTTLGRRCGTGSLGVGHRMLTGWMMPFNLHDECPQLANDVRLAHCMIIGSRVLWDVRRSIAQLIVDFIAPPQQIEVID